MLRDTLELDLTHKGSGRTIGVAPRVKLSSNKELPSSSQAERHREQSQDLLV